MERLSPICARRRGTVSDVASTKGAATYKRAYLFLKAQNTILTSINEMINRNLSQVDLVEKQKFETLIGYIKTLLTSTVKDLFTLCPTIIEGVRSVLNLKNNSPILEKICTMLLISALSFMRFSSLLLSKQQQENNQAQEEIAEPSKLQPTSIDPTKYIVCRVCDELVPLELMEEHTVSCFAAYKTEEHLATTNSNISETMQFISNKFMSTEWPGDYNIMTNKTLIALQIYFLLERALNVEPKLVDSVDELDEILADLWELPDRIEFTEIIRQSAELVKGKLKLSFVLAESGKILRQTRVSGSAQAASASTTSLSDFCFLKKVSAGAYAAVYLAQKKSTGEIYAVKVQARNGLQQKNQMRRVLTEKDILLQLSNDYIVRFYWSFSGRNNLYLVMEYLPGGDLFSLLQNVGALDEDSARVYTVQIVKALQFLHSQGIIHRDLKPDNVLIASTGRLKLTDFGLSHLGVVGRQSQADPTLATASSLVGTPDYIAPEVLLNQPHSFAVDYWSLGAIVFELLAGEPPFHGENETETHTNILRRRLEFDPEIFSESAADFISGLLTIDPSKRLGSKGADEILGHPWLRGVDENTPPPFVPELAGATDTGYFTERYVGRDGLDLEDVIEDDASGFSSVSVSQLVSQNKEAVRRMSGQRSSLDGVTRTSEPPSSPLASPGSIARKARMYERRRSHMGSPLLDAEKIRAAVEDELEPRVLDFDN